MSRLFLIDDHTLMREALRMLLEGAGHQVVGESGEPTQALSEVARLAPDVVLLDLALGGRSGFEVLAEMKRRELGARVVVLTMSEQPQNVAEAMRLGVHGYVLKGAPSAQLLTAIESAAAGRRYLAPDEAELAVRGLSQPPAVGYEQLSPRERQILVMVARGESSASIGKALHISAKTVDTYRSRLMSKLGLGDVPAVVRWAIRHKLVDADEA